MNIMGVKPSVFAAIKVVSTILITGAIGLEAWNRYAVLAHQTVPSSLIPVFWIERFALISHFIEAIIAAGYAPSKNKLPLSYGIYTFFVGTVGLLELFDRIPDQSLLENSD